MKTLIALVTIIAFLGGIVAPAWAESDGVTAKAVYVGVAAGGTTAAGIGLAGAINSATTAHPVTNKLLLGPLGLAGAATGVAVYMTGIALAGYCLFSKACTGKVSPEMGPADYLKGGATPKAKPLGSNPGWGVQT